MKLLVSIVVLFPALTLAEDLIFLPQPDFDPVRDTIIEQVQDNSPLKLQTLDPYTGTKSTALIIMPQVGDKRLSSKIKHEDLSYNPSRTTTFLSPFFLDLLQDFELAMYHHYYSGQLPSGFDPSLHRFPLNLEIPGIVAFEKSQPTKIY